MNHYSGQGGQRWLPSNVKWLLVSAAMVLGLLGCAEKPETPKYITDAQGRALILHGVNVSNSAKEQAHPPELTEARVARQQKDWGFNYVRYLIFWDFIEPERGVYDEAYLDGVEQRIKWYTDRGMYVMLDMHQDLYSRYASGLGRGAPEWATISEGAADIEIPSEWVSKYWWMAGLKPEVAAAAKNFWEYGDYKFLQDHYIDAWQHVAERFKNNPYVIGYDLMNEPFPGFIDALNGGFGANELPAFYNRLIPAMREVDQDKWLFIEPQSFGVTFGMLSTLPVIEDTRAGAARLAYAPHLYPLSTHEGTGYGSIDKTGMQMWNHERTKEVNAQQAPLIVGEFGGTDNQEGILDYFDDVTELMDYMSAGWAYWSHDCGSWGLIDCNGAENPKTNHLVRVYPQAIAGEPIAFRYNARAKAFELSFKNKAGVTGPTEIYVPASRHFKEGWEVVSSDEAGTWSQQWDAEREVLKIWHNPNQDLHTIKIHAKYRALGNAKTGLCVDGEQIESGDNAYVHSCHGATNQRWRMYADGTIRSKRNDNICLDVSNALIHNGNNVIVWECNGGNNQKWAMGTDGTLASSVFPNKCLDIDEASNNLRIWDCHGGGNQQFTWTNLSGDNSKSLHVEKGDELHKGQSVSTSRIRLTMQQDGNLVLYGHFDGEGAYPLWATGTHDKGGHRAVFQTDGNLVVYTESGKALWASHTNGQILALQTDRNLVIYDEAGKALWSRHDDVAQPAPDYSGVLGNLHTGLCADGSQVNNGDNAYMHKCHGGSNQRWKLYDDGSIRSERNTNMCLDVANALIHNGNNVLVWECKATLNNNQKWTYENGALKSWVFPNKCLDISSEGNLQLWDCIDGHSQKFLWAPEFTSNNSLNIAKNTRLNAGQSVSNSVIRLSMQYDGNLVLYAHFAGVGSKALWSTATGGNGNFAVFQGDGNLVVYNASGAALWASHTSGEVLKLQSDRNMVIYGSSDALWSTKTAL